jgi:hypothetical protein
MDRGISQGQIRVWSTCHLASRISDASITARPRPYSPEKSYQLGFWRIPLRNRQNLRLQTSFNLRDTLLKRIGLMLASILTSLRLGEVSVHLFEPVQKVAPTLCKYDAYLGKRLGRDFADVRLTPGLAVLFTTNSEGFRSPRQRMPWPWTDHPL